MCQPLKQIPRAAATAWCATESAPTLLALGSSSTSTDLGAEPSLCFASYDLAKPGLEMDVLASVKTEGRRFSKLSWSTFCSENSACAYGLMAGGTSDGVLTLYNPYGIISSRGADAGVVVSRPVHNGAIHDVQFHPMKPNCIATCGADGEVNIVNVQTPNAPDVMKPSQAASKHAGSEVLCCAWNRKVQHIICSCSNTGMTVVWDLKMKKEVINFRDPASRQRCSSVAWNPELPTQLLVAYDDDRQPSMQLWDLRNVAYPIKETAGHSKGILGVAWNTMDSNLLLSCGKDNRLLTWCLSSGSPELFCEVSSAQAVFEAQWSPHKPGIVSAASYSGLVSVHSMQQQQIESVKYVPNWYKRPCGVSFGFGGKMLSFGKKASTATPAPPDASWCHSLVVPNEPEVVPAADAFESWIAEGKLRQYCLDKVHQSDGTQHESLMWKVMGAQFESHGARGSVAALLGFNEDDILRKAESFLGSKPGTTLGSKPPEPEQQQPSIVAAPQPAPMAAIGDMDDFFTNLAAENEQKQKEEEERKAKEAEDKAAGEQLALAAKTDSKTTDWSAGPELMIKEALLIGNLEAAVECCFKSGKMAEGLLLSSGGGTELWTRARDEYLRLQGDAFLTTVGNIMTNDFETLVANSNLSNWMETLAILATYSGEKYCMLCEQLGERLEKEKIEPRSAMICYICAGNFTKTVNIWSSTHIATQGSQKLGLQGLVEKMTVLQDAVKFNQADMMFNSKLTQYAEILANSGRLTAAMRYMTLLRDDASSAILRDRIYNSDPKQMQMFGRAPAFPFESTDVRITYKPPQPAYTPPAYNTAPKAPAPRGPGHMPPNPAARPNPYGPGPGAYPSASPPGVMPPAPQHSMPPNPSGMPGVQPPSMAPAPAPGPANSMMPPAPRMNMGMPPNPAANPSMPPAPHSMGPSNPMMPPAPSPAPAPSYGAPAPSMAGVRPPGHAGMAPPVSAPVSSGPPSGPPRLSTAPTASAAPVVDGMPVPWPLPTAQQQKGSRTQSVKDANAAVQNASVGSGMQPVGAPMDPNDMQLVQRVLTMLLDASSQDGNTRKRDDIAKRLQELYDKLAGGFIKPNCQLKLVEMVKCLEAGDYGGANRIYQVDLASSDWDVNKAWLQGVKRLLPTR
mmetsp:Transcript_11336/g.21478  ORF Transcript_11336/g.21478 Transcript_11336/m.21478 type:complete len:1133 (-) Transcript_11336:68-3466(-)